MEYEYDRSLGDENAVVVVQYSLTRSIVIIVYNRNTCVIIIIMLVLYILRII